MLVKDLHFLLQNPRTPEGFQKGSLNLLSAGVVKSGWFYSSFLGYTCSGGGGGLVQQCANSLETRESKLLWRDIPGFCRDILEVLKKFEERKVACSIFVPYFGPFEVIFWFCQGTAKDNRPSSPYCPPKKDHPPEIHFLN